MQQLYNIAQHLEQHLELNESEHVPEKVLLCIRVIPRCAAAGTEFVLLTNSAGQLFSLGQTACFRDAKLGEEDFGKYQATLGHNGILVQEMEASEPRMVETLMDEAIISVAAGTYHSMALSETGQVYTWCCADHQNGSEQIGHGIEVSGNQLIPTSLFRT